MTQLDQMIFTLNTGLLTGLCSAGSLISVKASLWYVSLVADVFSIATCGSRHIRLYGLSFQYRSKCVPFTEYYDVEPDQDHLPQYTRIQC